MMNRKFIVGAAIAATLVLALTWTLQPGPPKGVVAKALDFSYACGNGVPVRVVFAADFQAVKVYLPDQTFEMTQAIAASGIRYTGGGYTFWSKGEEAFVMKGEEIVIADCRKV